MRRAILIAVALIPLSAVSAATLNGKAEIVDGDTIKVGGLPDTSWPSR